jgi:hypothetical protein
LIFLRCKQLSVEDCRCSADRIPESGKSFYGKFLTTGFGEDKFFSVGAIATAKSVYYTNCEKGDLI